jgi:hypothetical protein
MSVSPTEAPGLPLRPDTLCPWCGHIAQHTVAPGSGPHAARLQCEKCNHFLKWLSRVRK